MWNELNLDMNEMECISQITHFIEKNPNLIGLGILMDSFLFDVSVFQEGILNLKNLSYLELEFDLFYPIEEKYYKLISSIQNNLHLLSFKLKTRSKFYENKFTGLE